MKSIKKLTAIVAMMAVLAMSALGCGQKLAPADQTIGALFELTGKNNAAPMKELLGFASEEEVMNAFFEEGVAEKGMEESIEEALAAADMEMSEEDMADFTTTLTDMINKITYTAEITSESSDAVQVTLHVNGFKTDDMANVMMDAATAMQNSITEEDMTAIQGGDEEVYNKYIEQYLRDFISGLGALEVNPESVDIVVDCEKLSVEAESGNKIAWLPTDMDAFTTDVENAMMQ